MTFREVYEAHFSFVWRSLRRLGMTEPDAADASQEVFVVVHKRLALFEGRAKITTWLFRICMNVAHARQKHLRRRKEVVDDAMLEEQACDCDDPVEKMMAHEGLALLDHALSRMPLEQRAVFTLFELEQMSCQEIAEILEIPLGTVYSRLRLGRVAFQRTARRLRAGDPAVALEGGPHE